MIKIIKIGIFLFQIFSIYKPIPTCMIINTHVYDYVIY